MVQISIILPAYNEAGNIGSVIDQVTSFMCDTLHTYEIIVVNDGSTDSTADILHNIQDKHVSSQTHEINQGYGQALRTGFEAAQYTWLFFMDADMQFDFADIAPFLKLAESGTNNSPDLIIGYRAHRQDTAIRRLNSRTYAWFCRVFMGIHVRDLNCAFKLMKKDIIDRMHLSEKGALINAEILIKAAQMNAHIVELPVHHFPRVAGVPTGAKPHVVFLAMYRFIMLKLRVMFGRKKILS